MIASFSTHASTVKHGKHGKDEAGSREAAVDLDGFILPKRYDGSVDVVFDGRRIWSVAVSDYPANRRGMRHVPWPELLVPFLRGRANVELRDHLTQELIYGQEVTFHTDTGRVRLQDEDGRPWVIDKWGFLQLSFLEQGPAMVAEMLDATELILSVLSHDCQLPAWIAFGSLLGAVRDQALIGHDNDIDVAYLSPHESPADVALEMFRVSRALRRRGLFVVDKSGSFVTVMMPLSDGSRLPVDVYACFYLGDTLYETASVAAPVPRSAVLPIGEVVLEGRLLPAPADPARLLEASYGPGWRISDPAFRYETPDAITGRFMDWFGSLMMRRRHWDRLYRGILRVQVPKRHSGFAAWTLPQLPVGAVLLDVGCGNGRDTLWFARHGVSVVGFDFAPDAIRLCRARVKQERVVASFRPLNLYDFRDTLTRGSVIAHTLPKPRVLYARFMLHALEDGGRRNLWRLADMVLRGDGLGFFEFRTHRDATLPHHHHDHFRKFLEPDQVCSEIEAAGGLIEARVEGTGLSPYGDEDPDLCRLRVRWR